MKKCLLTLVAVLSTLSSFAQITITAADMPVSGDTLRYGIGDPATFLFNAADSGISKSWDYSTITSVGQGVDSFKTAASVHVAYAVTISPTAYGYKYADSFPGLSTILPITFNNLYTFFNKKTSPPRYVAAGFGAMISGIPTAANYSDEDEWYIFPLSYLSTDSTTFALKFSLPGTLTIKQSGSRKTRVDGWGTIKTPHFKTPAPCIRVRSEIKEIDSFDIMIAKLGLPRNSVEYKFLVNGYHYPALWVTTTIISGKETVSSVRYAAAEPAPSAISTVNRTAYQTLQLIPNPAGKEDMVQVAVPPGWRNYTVELYDLQSRLISSQQNADRLNVKDLLSGNYVIRVTSGTETGIAILTK